MFFLLPYTPDPRSLVADKCGPQPREGSGRSMQINPPIIKRKPKINPPIIEGNQNLNIWAWESHSVWWRNPDEAKKLVEWGGPKKLCVCVCGGVVVQFSEKKLGGCIFPKIIFWILDFLFFGIGIFEIMATWPWAEAMELRPAVQKENFCPWFQIRIGSEINLTLYWPNWHYIDQSQIWDHFGPF